MNPIPTTCSRKKYRIDILRQKMVASGLSHEEAGIATGLTAEYAMNAYCDGYSKGYNDGYSEGACRQTRKLSTT